MIHVITNGKIELSVNDKGGEMMSLIYNGAEYLWQGDPKYWSDRAINLFPVNGRLKDGSYIFKGKAYKMDIHGFVRRSDLTCIEKTNTKLVFELKSNKLTLKEYPFIFSYKIAYELNGNTVIITYIVENLQDLPIYFCLGGHPGFNVPLDNGNFDDYYLEFGEECPIKKVGFDKNCLITGEYSNYPLHQGKFLPLKHSLFDDDAIFFKDMSKIVTLKSDITSRSVTVAYEDFSYLGLWHTPNTSAPYLCIEPWSALPSYDDHMDDLETKKDITMLTKGRVYSVSWSIILN